MLRQRCTTCGHIPSFPRIACPACFAELDWFESSGAGRIRTYAILRRTHAEQYADHLPIVLALIEFVDGGEMISTIVGPDRERAEIDATVEFAGTDGWSMLPQFRLASPHPPQYRRPQVDELVAPSTTVSVLVIGSGLREVCGDQAALGLRFVADATTAPKYRLLVIDEAFAALVEDERSGATVKGELVEVDRGRYAEIVAGEPDGISAAPVELSNGRSVLAAFADPVYVADRATDITAFGGFAAYRASLEETSAT